MNEHEKTCGTTKISSSSCVVWYCVLYWRFLFLKGQILEKVGPKRQCMAVLCTIVWIEKNDTGCLIFWLLYYKSFLFQSNIVKRSCNIVDLRQYGHNGARRWWPASIIFSRSDYSTPYKPPLLWWNFDWLKNQILMWFQTYMNVYYVHVKRFYSLVNSFIVLLLYWKNIYLTDKTIL